MRSVSQSRMAAKSVAYIAYVYEFGITFSLPIDSERF